MKIIATNDQLNIVSIYDLGPVGRRGPDYDRFNEDVARSSGQFSTCQFMDEAEFARARAAQVAGVRARLQEEVDRAYRRSQLRICVLGGAL